MGVEAVFLWAPIDQSKEFHSHTQAPTIPSHFLSFSGSETKQSRNKKPFAQLRCQRFHNGHFLWMKETGDLLLKQPCPVEKMTEIMVPMVRTDSTILHLDESAIIEEVADAHVCRETSSRVLEYGTNNNMAPVLEDPVPLHVDLEEPLLQSEARAIHPIIAQASSCTFYHETDHLGFARPEYLFAKACKPSPDASVGIFLTMRNNALTISRISADSPFAKSNLRAGDRVVSVNGVSCLRVRSARIAAKLIRAAKCSVSITVRNKGGNPNVVSSCVQKPNPSCRVGITFQSKRGALQLSRVDTDGLLGDSLIVPRHTCLMINGHVTLNATSHDGASIIRDAPDFVTIVSRPDGATAMVLASERMLWRLRAAVCLGLAAGTLSAIGTLSN